MNPIQIPGPQFGLNEIIDALTQTVIEKNDKKYSPIRPSSAGKCTRELGYEQMEFRGLKSYPKESKASSVHRLLNFGHSVERHVIDEMYKAFAQNEKPIQIKYKQQTLSFGRLPDGTNLEGSMDLAIEGENFKMVCDIKSKGDKYSSYFRSSWDEFVEKLLNTGFAVKFGEDAVYITDLEKFLSSGFDPFFCNNLYQLNFYACNQFLVERGYNLASVIQLNKNDSRLREVRFTPSQAVAASTMNKFSKVVEVIDRDKSPEALPKDYSLGSMKCGFCPFRSECYPENDALKAYFKDLPPKKWAKDIDWLPKDIQDELTPLFNEYLELETLPDRLDYLENQIVKTLDKANVYKVRLNKGQDSERVFTVKHLKTGGPGGGPRRVLRRDKN